MLSFADSIYKLSTYFTWSSQIAAAVPGGPWGSVQLITESGALAEWATMERETRACLCISMCFWVPCVTWWVRQTHWPASKFILSGVSIWTYKHSHAPAPCVVVNYWVPTQPRACVNASHWIARHDWTWGVHDAPAPDNSGSGLKFSPPKPN